MIGPQELLEALGAVLIGLGSVVWWVVRANGTAVESERKEREEDHTKLRAEINAVGGRLTEHQLHVAREYVSTDGLHAAMKPMEDGLARLEDALVRLFQELKGKQDRGMT